MNCTTFLAVWADEASEIVPSLQDEGSTLIVVHALDLAETVNRALPAMNGLIAIVNGVTLSENWLRIAVADINGHLALSPWVSQEGADPRPWWEPVYPNAFFVKSQQLDAVGGLDERLAFHHHRVIAQKFPLDLCDSDGDIIATPISNANREKVMGDLYYRHLEDDRILREES